MDKKELTDTLTDFYQKLIEPNFKRLEENVKEHDKRFDEILGHLDAFWKKLETFEQEYYSILSGIRRIEESLKTGTRNREALEKEVRYLKEQVLDLQGKIETLESRFSH